jgi:elongation factor G
VVVLAVTAASRASTGQKAGKTAGGDGTGVPPERLRTVALVGHSGAGKTSLAEALLHRAGAVSRLGRVEQGTTVCDHDAAEQARGMSLSLAVAPFEWRDCKINLIDTPGYADFAADVVAALRVADLAVFVVSAVDGVQAQTESAWRIAAELRVPRLFFVNKLDAERADFERTLEQLRVRFGAGVAPLELPIGRATEFRGIADLLSDTAHVYESGTPHTEAIPDDMAALEHQVHDNLVEGIVVADEELLVRYLDGDVPAFEELERALGQGVADAVVFPVVCGSALAEVAIDRLADFLCELGPSPLSRPVTVSAGDLHIDVPRDPEGDPLAFVFKTIADPFVGHVSMFSVLSGTIGNDDLLYNPRTGTTERMHGLFVLRGKEHVPVGALCAGDIGGVAKLNGTITGDTLTPKGKPVRVTPIGVPEPSLTNAIVARTPADEDKLPGALQRMQEEDPALVIDRDDETHQTLLRGTGETHLAVTLERLARKFGVNVDVEPVLVRYRETIVGSAEGEGKQKKQSGGHGQFAVCNLRLDPLPRGEQFSFDEEVIGGAVPRQFVPAVQKGVEETMLQGGVFGYPVVDVAVTLFDGKFHTVDSSEAAFKAAARLAFRAAMAKASPVLLEPISQLVVTIPSDKQGDVLADLTARRGRVQRNEAIDDHEHVVHALVPTAEIARYAIDLRSLTAGRGRFTETHAHYDNVPANLIDKIRRANADE